MKYLVVIKAVSVSGVTTEGNVECGIGVLTAASLREVTNAYCMEARTRGFVCRDEDALVMAVIPLQA